MLLFFLRFAFILKSKKIISDFVAHTDSVNDICRGFNEYQLLST